MSVNRILVGFDGSEDAKAALAYALFVGDHHGASVDVLYVAPDGGLGRSEVLGQLEHFVASRRLGARHGLTLRVAYGEPCHVLGAAARLGEYDLVTLGRHGVHGAMAGTGHVAALLAESGPAEVVLVSRGRGDGGMEFCLEPFTGTAATTRALVPRGPEALVATATL